MEGWVTKPIGKVICKTATTDPRKLPKEKFQYVDVSGVSNKTLEITEANELLGSEAPSRARRVISEGDVIFATVRPTLRRIAVVPSNLDGEVCSTGYFVFQPNKELYNRYLFYFLQSDYFMGEMEKLQAGASYPAVNDTQVKSTLISYPLIPEQKRIVAILDQAFADIEQARAKTEQNLKNARELFESYLQQVFSQRGEGWVEKAIGEVADLSRGQNPPKSEFIYEPREGYVRFYQIRDGKSDKFAVYVPANSKLHYVNETDILMVAYRHVGGAFRGVKGAFNVALCKIVNKNKDALHDDFLFHLIPSSFIKGELLKVSERSLIPSMSVKHLAGLKIPIPPPHDQDEIVRKINIMENECSRLESLYKLKLNDLDELKKSILQKAFSGELTKTIDGDTSKGAAA